MSKSYIDSQRLLSNMQLYRKMPSFRPPKPFSIAREATRRVLSHSMSLKRHLATSRQLCDSFERDSKPSQILFETSQPTHQEMLFAGSKPPHEDVKVMYINERGLLLRSEKKFVWLNALLLRDSCEYRSVNCYY